MDKEVIKNALGSLDELLTKAHQAIRDASKEKFGYSDEDEFGGYDNPDAALDFNLQKLHDVLSVVLEAEALPETRTNLIETFESFKKGDNGLGTINYDEDYQSAESPALT